MAYIGSKPANRYSTLNRQVITGDGGTLYTLDYPVANENELEVFVNNVRQQPGNAYSASGTTLSMSGNVANTDSFYVVYQGKSVGSISIPEKGSSGDYNFDNGTLYIDVANSRVGIGNTSPVDELTVTGNVLIDGNTHITGNLSVGTGTVVISNNSVSIDGQAVSPAQSFRNKIINGNFDYWQRANSVNNVADGQYVADRWVTFRAGTTANVSRQSFTVGQTDVPNEPTFFYRTVVNSVAGSSNNCTPIQRIEGVRTFAGQKVTLSFWAKADGNKNISTEFIQYFGTGGSPSATENTIGVTTHNLSTSWQKFTVTIDIPSISGKNIGTNNDDYLGVLFWLDAGSTYNSRTNSLGQQSGTFDIAQVQLEAGSVATPFELRPLAAEEVMCYRYYQTIRVNAYATSATFSSYAPDFYYPMSFNTPMRVTPTMSRTSITDSGVTGGVTSITKNGFTVIMELTSAFAQSIFTATASAEL